MILFHFRVAVPDRQRSLETFAIGLLVGRTHPSLLIDTDCRLIASNSAARACLDTGDVLLNEAGRITGRGERITRALCHAIEELIGPGERTQDERERVIRLPPPAPFGVVLCLQTLARAAVNEPQIGQLLLATLVEPWRQPHMKVDAVAAAFALTAAESKVLQLLAEGREPVSAATELHLSVNTIRTHIRSIYRKTETDGNLQLLRLLHQLAR